VSPRRLYVAGLDAALHGAGLPYGYTVTVWASGQMLIVHHGTPGTAAVFAYAGGAALAYGLLRLSTNGASSEIDASELAADEHLVRNGAIHIASIAAAIGAVTLLALVPTAVVWPLGGLCATVVYLGGTAVVMALRERERRRGA
jgi:hypothetical protein